MARRRLPRNVDRRELEQRLRDWAEITELCLALRGSGLVRGGQRRSWRACVRAGLAEANRERERDLAR